MNYIATEIGPDYWVRLCPVFGRREDELLATTVLTLFDENSSNHFYISLGVQIFNHVFFWFN